MLCSGLRNSFFPSPRSLLLLLLLISSLLFFFCFSCFSFFLRHQRNQEAERSMEFVAEVFSVVVLSVFTAFLFAKLVSMISPGDNEVYCVSRSKKVKTEAGESDDAEVETEKRIFEDELRNIGLESVRKVEFVEGEAVKVEKFLGESAAESSKIERHEGGRSLEEEVQGKEEAIGVKEDVKEERREISGVGLVEERSMEAEVFATEVKSCKSLDDGFSKEKLPEEKQENSEVHVTVRQSEEKEQIITKDEQIIDPIVENGEDKERGGASEKEGLLEDDDDWEGIERSGVEKRFDAAARFVGSADNSDRLSKLGNDLQMQLHGLYKVATEGPCYEPPPMALMVSARAKWNSWQRLGSMSPEVAMEQYITLLSDGVPGWEGENSDGDCSQVKRNDSSDAGEFGNIAHGNQSRIVDVESTYEGVDMAEGVNNM